MAHDIQKRVLKFYAPIARDPHHRLRSWEHCYLHFRRHATFTTPEHLDTAALHLAFYLASWGMYRGSTALLWKDYQVHTPVVATLLEPKYAKLWDFDLRDKSVPLVVSLAEALRSTYGQQFTGVGGTPRLATDTLITKVLLGTMGCTPARDNYFVTGFRRAGFRCSRFGRNFLDQVLQFYRDHVREFEAARDVILERSGVAYPPMKLVDMYFFTE
jgi:hypothetical protein